MKTYQMSEEIIVAFGYWMEKNYPEGLDMEKGEKLEASQKHFKEFLETDEGRLLARSEGKQFAESILKS